MTWFCSSLFFPPPPLLPPLPFFFFPFAKLPNTSFGESDDDDDDFSFLDPDEEDGFLLDLVDGFWFFGKKFSNPKKRRRKRKIYGIKNEYESYTYSKLKMTK